MPNLSPEQQALVLAGVMADYALGLVGGLGVNGPIPPVHPDEFSECAKKLRLAAESYNNHLFSMARNASH